MSFKRTLAAAGVICLVSAAGVACGSEKKGDDSDKAEVSGTAPGKKKTDSGTDATPAAQPNGIDKLPAQEIATRVAKAMKGLSSMRMVLDYPEIGFDLAADTKGNCVGSTRTGGRLEIVKRGDDVYLKGDKAFWKSATDAKTAAAVERKAGGRYVKASTDNAAYASDALENCDLTTMQSGMSAFFSSSKDVTKQGVTTVNGIPAVPLRGTFDGADMTMFVALRGEPYLLKGESNEMRIPVLYKDHNVPVPDTAPPADQTVDASEIPELADAAG